MTDYIIDLLLIMMMGLPIYAIARAGLLYFRARSKGAKKNRKRIRVKVNKFREVCLGLFVVFMMALLCFVWHGYYGEPQTMLLRAKVRLHTMEGINLVPFRTIRDYYRVYGVHGNLFGINIYGNILMFVPWGFGLMLLWKKNRTIPRTVFFALALPLLIECVQLFIGRQVDVDDVLLNFTGALLGALLYCVLVLIFPKIKTAAL